MNRLIKTAALVACLALTTALAELATEAAQPEISSGNMNDSVELSRNPVPASKLPPIKDYKTVPFGGLDVITAGYPRVIYFRSPTETAGRPDHEFEDYEYWKSTMLNLSGFVGKGLDEENLRFDTARPSYMRFKKEHPRKLALVHINGNARSPNFALDEFAPFFFSHFVGTQGVTEIRPDEEISTIQVENPAAFREKIGRGLTANDDITICRLGTDGKPDWSYYEEVKLQGIDPEHSTITVRRGCFGTEAKAFQSGDSYLAAHLFEGPFGEKDQILWYYNYSLASPRDSKGRQLPDVLAEDIGRHFTQGGSCEALDGMECDVLHDSRWDTGDRRLGYDFDHDGVADGGHRDPDTGLSNYTLGVHRFLAKLREIVGDEKLIMADGHGGNAQRACGSLNGIESEGWPVVFDPDIRKWSKGMNVNLFWAENAKRPHFSYIKLRDHLRPQVQANDGSWQREHRDPPNVIRLVMAVACLTDNALASAIARPEIEFHEWDEFHGGDLHQLGYLGQPLGPVWRLAQTQPDLLQGAGKGGERLAKLLTIPAGVKIGRDGDVLTLTGSGSAAATSRNRLEFALPLPENCPKEITVFATMSAAPQTGYPAYRPRRVFAADPAGESNVQSMVSDTKPFTAVFYYKDLQGDTIGFSAEAPKDAFRVHEITVHAYPDVCLREFERGVVIVNPAAHPVTLNLKELLPGRKLKRLKGTQFPTVNSGRPVGDTIEIPVQDAIFLIHAE